MSTRRKREWFDDEALWREMYPYIFHELRVADGREVARQVLALVMPRGRRILDLCCGPGRYAVPLAKRGYAVTGVDRTRYFLNKARARARAAKVEVEWVRSDMRDFVRPDSFDLVLSLYTSFGYFEDRREDLTVLGNILASLRPGGACVIEVGGKEWLANVFDPTGSTLYPDGTLLVERREVREDWTRLWNEWYLIRNGRARRFTLHLRIYSGQELRERMERVGFTDVKLYGSLNGEPYGRGVHRLVAVGRKPERERVRVAAALGGPEGMHVPRRKREWFDDDSLWRELYPSMFSEERFAEAARETGNLLRLVRPRGRAVLDLCCGPGRYAVPLAKRGYAVTGVDRTRYLLDRARARARAARVGVEWVRSDMRDFARPEAFDLVLNMDTSFGYFDDKREDVTVLGNMLASLRPGGVCLIQLSSKEWLARIFTPTTSRILPDGAKLVQRHEIIDDWTGIRNEWTLIRGGRARSWIIQHRVYSGQELHDRMEQAGFVDVKLYGDMNGGAYGRTSPWLMAVGRKPGRAGRRRRAGRGKPERRPRR